MQLFIFSCTTRPSIQPGISACMHSAVHIPSTSLRSTWKLPLKLCCCGTTLCDTLQLYTIVLQCWHAPYSVVCNSLSWFRASLECNPIYRTQRMLTHQPVTQGLTAQKECILEQSSCLATTRTGLPCHYPKTFLVWRFWKESVHEIWARTLISWYWGTGIWIRRDDIGFVLLEFSDSHNSTSYSASYNWGLC